MRSTLIALSALIGATVSSFAEEYDVVMDYKGESIEAKVLRFEDNTFTLSTTNGLRTLPVEEVTSIFFDLNRPIEPAPAPVPAPQAAPDPAPAAPKDPPRAPRSEPAAQAPERPAEGGPLNKLATVQRVPPPYGAVESSLLSHEVKNAGAGLVGKVVKVEFHFRSALRTLPDGRHFVSLHTSGDWSGLWVLLEDEAVPWFRQIPEQPSFMDRNFQKARGYYVYGVVVEAPAEWASRQVMMGQMQMGIGKAYTIQPIGRKTQRGLRGALEYGW